MAYEFPLSKNQIEMIRNMIGNPTDGVNSMFQPSNNRGTKVDMVRSKQNVASIDQGADAGVTIGIGGTITL